MQNDSLSKTAEYETAANLFRSALKTVQHIHLLIFKLHMCWVAVLGEWSPGGCGLSGLAF